MQRATSDYDLLDEFTIDICNIVEKHCKYVIVSGFFAISCGRARGTEDIDMIIERIDYENFEKMHQELSKKYNCLQSEDPKEIYEYLIENASIRYTLKDRDIPEMEIKFTKDSLDKDQLQSRTKYKEITDLDIYFAPLEGQIAFKEEYLKSEKDLEDAKHLRIVFKDELSEDKIKYYKNKIREIKL